ncbi:DUF3105 domain-containing protein [Nocardioides sp.]|uniref:DUF3105 domain-containing protein n=1 Tax=Nocardioides sp. TaxID=35761 RepID=UPI002D806796|nr:DUF3105 domain-containing protein [Nocardioides sp.]HET8961667.1 DUF3105 domain-containing protein [Nocardioides sp.]
MTAGGRRRLVVVGVALVVLIGLAVMVQLLRGDDGPPSGLGEVATYQDLPRDHVESDVDYDQSPPVGGAHDPAWQNCGVYDQQVRDENAVHTLEHGALWITYDPSLSDEEVDSLADKLPEKGLLSPYDGQDAPVVVTVWEAQLALDGPDDPRLEQFIDEYSDGHTSPEPEVTCLGGVEEFEDPAGEA